MNDEYVNVDLLLRAIVEARLLDVDDPTQTMKFIIDGLPKVTINQKTSEEDFGLTLHIGPP